MHKLTGLRIVIFAFASLLMTVCSSAEQWKIVQAIGQVWISSEHAQPASLRRSTIVPDGASLRTGKRGRVMLMRGKQTMMLGPNARIKLDEAELGNTKVVQDSGNVMFSVDRRDVRHFEVETPYVAAIVKGTIFNVNVAQEHTEVKVYQGRVDVVDRISGDGVAVSAGGSAQMDEPEAIPPSARLKSSSNYKTVEVPGNRFGNRKKNSFNFKMRGRKAGIVYIGGPNYRGKSNSFSNDNAISANASAGNNNNAGGNGNGNSNGNSGDNGNGNSGGNGNGNSGGNGNGNSGGNGNGNSGGNGNNN